MGFITQAQADELAKSTVRGSLLVDFDFDDDPKYVWPGNTDLQIGERLYQPTFGLGAIEGLQETRGPVSQQVTFTLSGVPMVLEDGQNLLAITLADSDVVQGRTGAVAMQLFDAEWQPLLDALPLWFGVMGKPRVSRTAFGETEGPTQTIAVPAENLFYGRSRPPAGRYTDREQQHRSPGDRFFDRVPSLVAEVPIGWPR